ncbi:MAG: GatB/YqeY domain-containing protein [Richelia sp. RM2_1_2]|nr:GatB/YqeY domain-containing protein [Richelia sp. RM2_1_2]
MNIQKQIKQDLKTAMVNNDMAIKSILRVLLGEFDRVGKEVTDDQAVGVIKKMVENAVLQKIKLKKIFYQFICQSN